jgi:hypothetical protein
LTVVVGDNDRQSLAGQASADHHFTPTSASWTNMVEIFFGIIGRRAIRRGSFTVADLIGAIRAFIDGYNERCQPFRWTRTADQVLAKASRD